MLVTKQQATSDDQGAGGAAPASAAAVASAPGAGAVAGSGGTGAGAGDGARGGTPLVELKSFTTQIFFASWRALHLGLLQVRCGAVRRFCIVHSVRVRACRPPFCLSS